jgi:hypothetical protein
MAHLHQDPLLLGGRWRLRLSPDLLTGEWFHFLAQIFYVAVRDGVAKQLVDDGLEVGEGTNGRQGWSV